MKRIVRISTTTRQSNKQKSVSIPLVIIEKLNWENIKVAMFETCLDSNGEGYLVITKEDE
jgi:hypothetical protein